MNTSLDDEERLELAVLIGDWIEEHVVEEHVTYFNNGVHTTNNFLPWHRMHVRMLEDYLENHGGSQFVPLPKWSPLTSSYSANSIPTYFNGKTPEDTDYPDFLDPDGYSYLGSNTSFNFNYSVISALTSTQIAMMNQSCGGGFGDVGDFSEFLENYYHNYGHFYVGGAMSSAASTDCLIFWPWHAWVDEFWYKWEDDCDGLYTIIDPAPITGQVTWSGTQYVKGEVIIQSGGHLTIASNAVIHFQDSEYSTRKTRIVVKPGGKLTVDGATLTGIDTAGEGGGAQSGEPETEGVIYNTPWDGIYVKPTDGISQLTDCEIIIKNNAIVQHARIAIDAPGANVKITAENAKFKNNRKDVVLGGKGSYVHYSYSKFNTCEFSNDQPLRDAVWISGNIGDHPHHLYYKSQKSKSSENHVELFNVWYVNFTNCEFTNTFVDDNLAKYRSRGIYSVLSRFLCSGGIFYNQTDGIYAIGEPSSSVGAYFDVVGTEFADNLRGIVMKNIFLATIDRGCKFSVPGENTLTDEATTPVGIFSGESSAFIISGNEFTTDPGFSGTPDNAGIVVENACFIRPNWIALNDFYNMHRGAQTQLNNEKLQIRCNNFVDYSGADYAIAVTSGKLEKQGNCLIFPAGNDWDDLATCTGAVHQIYKASGAQGFQYDAHANLKPICVSLGVTVNECTQTSSEQPCSQFAPSLQISNQDKVAHILSLNTAIAGSSIPQEQELLRDKQRTESFRLAKNYLDSVRADSAFEALDMLYGQGVALYEGDLAAFAMEAGEWEAAEDYIDLLPGSDANKAYLEYMLPIKESGRNLLQLTSGEIGDIAALTSNDPPNEVCNSTVFLHSFEELFSQNPYDIAVDALWFNESDKPAQKKPTAEKQGIITQLVAYPNPASQEIQVQLRGSMPEQPGMLYLYDTAGRQCLRREMGQTDSQILQVDNLSPGMYWLYYVEEGQSYRIAVFIR